MPAIKRLNVEPWMKRVVEEATDPDIQEFKVFRKDILSVKPVVGKDGYYIDRLHKKCWFEYNGACFSIDDNYEDFLFTLGILNTPFLRKVEYDALMLLYDNKTPIKGLNKFTYQINTALYDRDFHRELKHNMFRLKGELKEILNDNQP